MIYHISNITTGYIKLKTIHNINIKDTRNIYIYIYIAYIVEWDSLNNREIYNILDYIHLYLINLYRMSIYINQQQFVISKKAIL